MTYRLKFDERVDKAWRRIVHEQIDVSIELLSAGTDAPVAVHETRKAMKRIRALLKLLRPGLSREDYKRENERFATIARTLSDARDADVMIATAQQIAELTTGESRTVALALAEDRRGKSARSLRGTGRRVPNDGSRKQSVAVAAAIKALRQAAKAVDKLRLQSTSFDVVRRGLARSYRRGRRAMERSFKTNVDEEFHEWRKWLQAHWRHMSLVSRAWPEVFEARMQLAKEMSDLLGADHDLYMLIASVREQGGRGASAAGRDGVISAARQRQQQIRDELHGKAAALFAEETDDFVARVEAYWEAAVAERKRQRKVERAARKAEASGKRRKVAAGRGPDGSAKAQRRTARKARPRAKPVV